MITKTEWLSLKLHCETICNLVYQLDSVEEDFSEERLASELESELTSMRTMISLLRGQICYSPVDHARLEGRS